MVEFGPTSMFRTLMIIAMVYYAVRMIMRYKQAPSKKDPAPGGTTVERKGQSAADDGDVGEYVDFEEVD